MSSPLPFPFNIMERLRFWTLLVAFAAYVISYYAPSFPLSEGLMLQIIVAILSLFGITVELRMRKLIRTLTSLGVLPYKD